MKVFNDAEMTRRYYFPSLLHECQYVALNGKYIEIESLF